MDESSIDLGSAAESPDKFPMSFLMARVKNNLELSKAVRGIHHSTSGTPRPSMDIRAIRECELLASKLKEIESKSQSEINTLNIRVNSEMNAYRLEASKRILTVDEIVKFTKPATNAFLEIRNLQYKITHNKYLVYCKIDIIARNNTEEYTLLLSRSGLPIESVDDLRNKSVNEEMELKKMGGEPIPVKAYGDLMIRDCGFASYTFL